MRDRSDLRDRQTDTLGDIGREQLARLCAALGRDPSAATAVFDVLGASWATRSTNDRRHSDITDDFSPYEFSVAFNGSAPELRLLVEAQGEGDAASNWKAAWDLNVRIEREFGASLESARRISDLFEPRAEGVVFSLWHAVSLTATGCQFRVYFNPNASGPANAPLAVEEAFGRAGLSAAWKWTSEQLFRPDRDRLLYYSVDLSSGVSARAKVYVAHGNATASEMEALYASVPGHPPDTIRRFCTAMANSEGPYLHRPLISTAAFRQGSDRPHTVALHMPIRCYAPDDEVSLRRISSLLSVADAATYERAVRALARRPLSQASGIQTYVSVKREREAQRVTIYLAPEAHFRAPEL